MRDGDTAGQAGGGLRFPGVNIGEKGLGAAGPSGGDLEVCQRGENGVLLRGETGIEGYEGGNEYWGRGNVRACHGDFLG